VELSSISIIFKENYFWKFRFYKNWVIFKTTNFISFSSQRNLEICDILPFLHHNFPYLHQTFLSAICIFLSKSSLLLTFLSKIFTLINCHFTPKFCFLHQYFYNNIFVLFHKKFFFTNFFFLNIFFNILPNFQFLTTVSIFIDISIFHQSFNF